MSKPQRSPVRKCIKKAALAGGVTATATAMTMGLAAPSASALASPTNEGVVSSERQVDLKALELADLTPDQILDLGDIVDLGGLLDGEALGDLLGGIDLGNLLGLADLTDGITGPLEALGINLVTTGPPFGLLSLFGVNLGYVPALPGLIENEVLSTQPAVTLPVVGGVRLPVVVGFGLGALSTGIAYPGIAEEFGGDENTLTIMPMLLLRNWGRADGGVAARFSPLLDPLVRLFGYDSVVTPDVENNIHRNILGIPKGGLIPLKIDATVEYDPFSDFAAWPNPVTLANNAAAFAFPTYILRGGDFAAAGDQLAGALPGVLAGLLDPEGELNVFLTVPADRQPILEPFRYPADIANLFTGGAFNFTNPFADAVEPAIKILGNLGYTNVDQEAGYDRDFGDNFGNGDLGDGPGGVPFFTFPQDVDWGEVPEDVFEAFVQGVTESFFFGGIPGVNNPYVNGPLDGATSGIYRSPFNVLGDLGSLLENLQLPDLTVPNPAAGRQASAPGIASIPENDPAPTITLDTTSVAEQPVSSEVNAQQPAQTQLPQQRTGSPATLVEEDTQDGASTTSTSRERGAGAKKIRDAVKDTRQAVRGGINRTADRVSDAAERVTKRVTGGLNRNRSSDKNDGPAGADNSSTSDNNSKPKNDD